MIKASNIYRYSECSIEEAEQCTMHLKFYNKLADAPNKLEPWCSQAVTSSVDCHFFSPSHNRWQLIHCGSEGRQCIPLKKKIQNTNASGERSYTLDDRRQLAIVDHKLFVGVFWGEGLFLVCFSLGKELKVRRMLCCICWKLRALQCWLYSLQSSKLAAVLHHLRDVWPLCFGLVLMVACCFFTCHFISGCSWCA